MAMGETEAGCCFTLGFCSFILCMSEPGPGHFILLGLSLICSISKMIRSLHVIDFRTKKTSRDSE